jgi:hypothetical protein
MRLNIDIRRLRRCSASVLGIILLGGASGGSAFAMGQSPANEPDSATVAAITPEENASSPARGGASLPDAPEPAFSMNAAPGEASSSAQPAFTLGSGMPESWGLGVTPNSPEKVPLDQCPYDTTRARECRVHWAPLIISASLYNAFQDMGNLYTGYWYRYETTNGKWFDRWIDSDAEWRWDRWDDDNPHMDQYVGHPMMGSITNYLWIQNDPKGATLDIGNNWPYWRSRLRATAFTTVFSFLWKLGPTGEAAVGHNGDHFFHDKGVLTNETGWVELVTTPVGGLLWTMAEDGLDKSVVKHLEEKPRRPVTLLLLSFLTPSRATANIFRWRPPWYRDGRVVKASTFWSDPPSREEEVAGSGEGASGAEAAEPSGGVQRSHNPEVKPIWPHPGGVHEFGAWWGLSLMSGHIWGYAKDIKYMPIDVNYSYLLHPGTNWNFRYAPELTAVAMLDEPVPNPKLPAWEQRKRTYGSGLSPVGFRASFYPESRVQPFLSTDGGFIYFMDRVLSPQGSQFMYTIDFGGGIQIFRKERQAVTIGYRYQHLSNANISHHNPGTDTNVFYLAVSRFRTKGYR